MLVSKTQSENARKKKVVKQLMSQGQSTLTRQTHTHNGFHCSVLSSVKRRNELKDRHWWFER